MTDLETLKAMLDRAGISRALRIEANAEGDRNLGYGFFFSELHFDQDGHLLAWGSWE